MNLTQQITVIFIQLQEQKTTFPTSLFEKLLEIIQGIRNFLDQSYRYLSWRKRLTNTYCLCPQTTKSFLCFMKNFSTKIENSHFRAKGTNTAHWSLVNFYQPCEWIWTPVDWKAISLMTTEQRLSEEGKFWSMLSYALKTTTKTNLLLWKPNQTEPNTKALLVLQIAFLTTLHHYYLSRSQYISNLNIKNQEYESVIMAGKIY